jgi:hypothetical protein
MRSTALSLVVISTACMPNPQSMRERRAAFDRASLMGSIISDRDGGDEPVETVFENRIELASYAIEPRHPARGDRVDVTFRWRTLRPVPEDYLVFVHGDAVGGNARRIFGDHLPAEGKYPSSVWRPGEYVLDRFSIRVPNDYGPSRLALFVGLYLGDHRLTITHPGRVPTDRENRTRPIELDLGR